jgi:hypothetical protein
MSAAKEIVTLNKGQNETGGDSAPEGKCQEMTSHYSKQQKNKKGKGQRK